MVWHKRQFTQDLGGQFFSLVTFNKDFLCKMAKQKLIWSNIFGSLVIFVGILSIRYLFDQEYFAIWL